MARDGRQAAPPAVAKLLEGGVPARRHADARHRCAERPVERRPAEIAAHLPIDERRKLSCRSEPAQRDATNQHASTPVSYTHLTLPTICSV
eukprot:3752168-Prymnesium_polylepis.1